MLFWALDRFSREGALFTLQKLQLLGQFGVAFFSYTEPYLNTVGIFKEALISILATLAKQERLRQSERVKAGLSRAKLSGTQLGRPQISPIKIEQVQQLRKKKLSIRKIASMADLSIGKVSDICRS